MPEIVEQKKQHTVSQVAEEKKREAYPEKNYQT